MAVICQEKEEKQEGTEEKTYYNTPFSSIIFIFLAFLRTRKGAHHCKQLNWKSTYKVNKLNHFLFSFFSLSVDGVQGRKNKVTYPIYQKTVFRFRHADCLHVSKSMHTIKMKNMRSKSILYANVSVIYLSVMALRFISLETDGKLLNHQHTHTTQKCFYFSPRASSSSPSSSFSSLFAYIIRAMM